MYEETETLTFNRGTELCPSISEPGQTKILRGDGYSAQDQDSVLFLSSKLQRLEVELKFNLDSLFGGVVFSLCFQSERKATISGSGWVTSDFVSYGFPSLEKKNGKIDWFGPNLWTYVELT